MKRIFLLLAVFTALSFSANAQYDDLYTFESGKSLIGFNVGVSLNDNNTAVTAFYEYGLSKLFVDECVLGGGFFAGYYKDKLERELVQRYIAGVRFNIHYQFVDRLDTYAGFDPNFNIRTSKTGKDSAKFDMYFHIGGRYYLTNWLGIFAEASTGYNNFSGGFSVKF
jgi:hypothetical protein